MTQEELNLEALARMLAEERTARELAEEMLKREQRHSRAWRTLAAAHYAVIERLQCALEDTERQCIHWRETTQSAGARSNAWMARAEVAERRLAALRELITALWPGPLRDELLKALGCEEGGPECS